MSYFLLRPLFYAGTFFKGWPALVHTLCLNPVPGHLVFLYHDVAGRVSALMNWFAAYCCSLRAYSKLWDSFGADNSPSPTFLSPAISTTCSTVWAALWWQRPRPIGPVQEHVFGRLVSENHFSLDSVTAGTCNFSAVFSTGSHLKLFPQPWFSLLRLYPSTLGLFRIAHIPSASLSRSQHCSCGFLGHRLPGTTSSHLGPCRCGTPSQGP